MREIRPTLFYACLLMNICETDYLIPYTSGGEGENIQNKFYSYAGFLLHNW